MAKTKSKASENERRVKENLAFRSGMRGNEAEPTRFLTAPNESQELQLEKPVYNPGEGDSKNPEYSLPGVKVGGPKDETEAIGRSVEERAKPRPGNLSTDAKLGTPTEEGADADDGDEETPDERPVYKSGMRGSERPERRRR